MNSFNFDRFRERLAEVDAVALLTLFGLLVGIAAGLVTVAFRALIEWTLCVFLPENSENFEGLSLMLRCALPFTGALLLGAIFEYLKPENRRTGVGYIVERFHLYQGLVSLRSLVVQFAGAAIALISGLSMGREGPAVHLGAASGSWLGQWVGLPNNSLRVLTCCGCAAAISASFNTPIAGVIFAIEVIMMEYYIASIIPIILASVSGAVITRFFYGHEPAFQIPQVELASFQDLAFILACGLIVGVIAAGTIYSCKTIALFGQRFSVGWRFFVAGAVTAMAGAIAPEILGIGYDTVNSTMYDTIPLQVLALILVLKLLATCVCTGLGVPAGVIGPTLLIGALVGAIINAVLTLWMPTQSHPALFVLLGMVGMMAATLAAPLAALMALLELTSEANIIFPGMLVIVAACLTANHALQQRGLFLVLLETQGIRLKVSPLASHLHRVGVQAAMNRQIKRVQQRLSREEAASILAEQPSWLLIDQDSVPTQVMPASALANYLKADTAVGDEPASAQQTKEIDLYEIPAPRDNVTPVLLSATLHEALETMNKAGVDAAYVRRMSAPGIYRVFGLIHRQDIERYY